MLPQRMLIQPDKPPNTHSTNVRPRFLLQRNKRSPSISSPAKQTLALNLFSNQTNVRPRFLFLLSKIRGQGQEGVGNLGGASDWASRGEVLCVIRGAPWVSDRCPRRAPGRVGPPSAQDITNYKLAKNPIPPKAATKPNPQRRLPQRTLPQQTLPNKRSPSAPPPTKHSSSLSSPTKQMFVLGFFSYQAKFEAKVRKVSET